MSQEDTEHRQHRKEDEMSWNEKVTDLSQASATQTGNEVAVVCSSPCMAGLLLFAHFLAGL